MNYEKMKMGELKMIAAERGIKVPNTMKKEEIIAALNSNVVEIYSNTKEEILAAVSPFVQKGMSVKFDDECWYFGYRGAEDSGNMKMPLKTIVRKAEMVGRGAFVPRILKNTGTDLDGALA